MSIKTNIKKEFTKELRTFRKEIRRLERYEVKHRSGIERASTLMLTVLTLFSLSGLGHDDHSSLVKKAVVVPAQPILSSTEKNETVRMPIKFDDGLRAVASTGQ